MAKYFDPQAALNLDLFPLVELGCTGDVIQYGEGYSLVRIERVVVKGFEDRELWVETYVAADGTLTGDWNAISVEELKSIRAAAKAWKKSNR